MVAARDGVTRLHCRMAGRGLPLVLVHGYLGGGAQWRDLLQAPPPGMRVLAPCLPGFGDSAQLPPPQTIAAFARAVLDFLAARDITRFALLGHSMGGMVAQEITRQSPQAVAALVLYATGPIGNIPGRFETIAQSREQLLAQGAAAAAARIPAKWLVGAEASPHYPMVAALAGKAAQAAHLAGLNAMECWDGRPALALIECPTLIMWGERDVSYPRPQIDLLLAGIAGAKLKTIPGASHLAHLEAAEVFNAALEVFLRAAL